MEVLLGKKVYLAMLERGMSVEQLAGAIGCTKKNVYKFFQKRSINTDLLLKLSQVVQHDFFAEISRNLQIGDSIQTGD